MYLSNKSRKLTTSTLRTYEIIVQIILLITIVLNCLAVLLPFFNSNYYKDRNTLQFLDLVEFATHDGSTSMLASYWMCFGIPLFVLMTVGLLNGWRVASTTRKLSLLLTSMCALLLIVFYCVVGINQVMHD